jgi:hypothetical protein
MQRSCEGTQRAGGPPEPWSSVRWRLVPCPEGEDIITCAIAGRLFNRGYEIVFDRDLRNTDKALSEIDVLRRLYDSASSCPS